MKTLSNFLFFSFLFAQFIIVCSSNRQSLQKENNAPKAKSELKSLLSNPLFINLVLLTRDSIDMKNKKNSPRNSNSSIEKSDKSLILCNSCEEKN